MQRRIQGTIHRVKISEGTWVDKDDNIAKKAIENFSDLFSGFMESSLGELMHLIPPMVTREESALLAEATDIEEVRHLVFTMDGESAADPDDFTSKFFTFSWVIIAQDMHRMVASFFCGSEQSRFVTSTSNVLLPKVSNPQTFSNFRPISLCNFFNKLLSKNFGGSSGLGGAENYLPPVDRVCERPDYNG
ncbi:uncharacterized protein [Coffea arabica]|uniref:Uncharacterized protein n=1 Tax=Coffea arabica TaxID=13443 RepID=A0ABM4WMV6_COFAR